jgi:hypothetical protein
MKQANGRFSSKGTVKVGKVTHRDSFSVDWKADPDEVMEQCERMLKEMGINVEFTSVSTGSDSYTYVAVKGE